VGLHGGMSLLHARQTLKQRQLRGCKVFTSAYVIPAGHVPGISKIDHIFDIVCALVDHCEPPYCSMADCALSLLQHRGLGLFMVGQILADMKNTRSHPLASAHDWFSWSSPGPGSCRGLSWYFKCNPESAAAMRNDFQSLANIARLEIQDMIQSTLPRICAQDFQNCLCEFSKWCKLTFLGGRARNLFHSSESSHVRMDAITSRRPKRTRDSRSDYLQWQSICVEPCNINRNEKEIKSK
jgi:hypothetical protein